MAKDLLDLSGERYGRWTVIKEADPVYDKNGYKIRRWLCKCSCNKKTEKIVRQSSLRSGSSLSCGCYQNEKREEAAYNRREDLVGKHFGRLTVINELSIYIQSDGTRCRILECYCDPELGGCGNTVKIRRRHLVSGHTKSCGCYKIDKSSNRMLGKNNPNYIDGKARHYKRIRNSRLRCNFGITVEEYEEMLEAQDGVCAICGQPETAKHKSGNIMHLAVDHNHDTGKIRGLLCNKCNKGLGMFCDNKELLASALKYMEDNDE